MKNDMNKRNRQIFNRIDVMIDFFTLFGKKEMIEQTS